MRNILIIGATRGLGQSLATQYASQGYQVYATARYTPPKDTLPNLHWISQVDITNPTSGRRIAVAWEESGNTKIDLLIICSGYFATETLEDLNFDKEVQMYKTCAIGPVFLVQQLLKNGLVKSGTRIVLVGGESGSIGLRHESGKNGGGGNYGGHGSKAALNMVGKLLSLDLREIGAAVCVVHTGYLRVEKRDGSSEITGPGKEDAVKPDQAATALRSWIETFDMSKTGQFWSVRGPEGITTAAAVLGPVETLPTPLELPW